MDRMEKLKEYLAAQPQDSFLQHALALEHLKIGQESEALNLFTSILNRDPDYIGSYYHLAQLLQRQGKKEEALYWYQQGMTRARALGDKHAYNELYMAYEDLADL